MTTGDSIGDMETMAGGPGGRDGYTLAEGESLGQYRIVSPLGRGGMGEVYEVEHEVLGRRYALKLLPADFASRTGALKRFQREARVMANLEHPNVVRVDEFGETGGRYWLRMELMGGVGEGVVSLADLAKQGEGRVDQGLLVKILKQVCEGLSYAHSRGAVHRDLKPGNILLEKDPSGELRAKVADFGLVRLVGEEWVRSQAQISIQRSLSLGEKATEAAGGGTSTKALLGTYEYMSPEQKRGEEAAARSDIYSLGMIAYRLVTGRTLSLKMPSQIDRSLAPAWDGLVAGALEDDPGERIPDCQAFGRMLAEVEEEIARKEREIREKKRREEEAAARREREEQEAKARREREAREAAARREREERERREAAERRELEEEARRREEAVPRPPPGRGSRRVGRTVGILLVLGAVAAVVVVLIQSNRSRVVPRPEEPARHSHPKLEAGPNTLGMEMVPVAGLKGVLFAKHETRVKDFRAFVNDRAGNGNYNYRSGSQPYILKSDGWKQRGWEYGWDKPGFSQTDDHPVTCVSWEDAKAFCEWLTRKEQDEGKISRDQEYRLPRDWEWSVAVGLTEPRQGSPKDKDEKIKNVYPWDQGKGKWGTSGPPRGAGNYAGEEAKDRYWPSNYSVISGYNDGYARTSPVCAFPGVNANSLCDMGGNVWEWCGDFYDGKSGSRVLRGGSWGSRGSRNLLSSYRGRGPPGRRYDSRGFRVVLGFSFP